MITPSNPFQIKGNTLRISKRKLKKNLNKLKKLSVKKKKLLKKLEKTDSDKLEKKFLELERKMGEFRALALLSAAIKKSFKAKNKKPTLINSEYSTKTENMLLKYDRRVLDEITNGVFKKEYLDKMSRSIVLSLPRINEKIKDGRIHLKSVIENTENSAEK